MAMIALIECMAARVPPDRFLVAFSTQEVGEWIELDAKFCALRPATAATQPDISSLAPESLFKSLLTVQNNGPTD
jgi:hypothetical protein